MASGSAASTSVPYVESTFAGAKRKSKDIGWELKQHIAQITGQTTSCSEATKEDQLKCRNAINEGKMKKQAKRQHDEAIRSEVRLDSSIEDDEVHDHSMKEPNVFGPMDNFANVVNPEQSLERGRGKKVELSNAIRKERMWMTKKYSASEYIYEYVDACIQEVGAGHVVQIVTDSASNNMGAAALLKVTRPKIFWTSCATHTVNLMLEVDGNRNRDEEVEVQDQEAQWEVNGEAMEADEYLQPRQSSRTTTKTTQRELFDEEFESGSEEVVYEEGDYESDGAKIIEVIVGGTNYYIQALVSRFLLDDSLKDTDESCFGENYGDEQPDTQILPEQENFCYTYESLKVIDPVAANRIHPNDHRKKLQAPYQIYPFVSCTLASPHLSLPIASLNLRTLTKGVNTFKHSVTPAQNAVLSTVANAAFPLTVPENLHSSHLVLENICLNCSFFSDKLCKVRKEEANLVTPGRTISFLLVKSLIIANVLWWAYESAIPFHAFEEDSFKMLLEVVGQFGPGLPSPTRYELSTALLKEEVERTNNLVKRNEKEWKAIGCSIMTNA
nr:tRNA dimethylallyltransferase 2 isoform X1 [Tanacetum cinerariifolium]